MGVTAASGAQGNEVALGFRVKSGWAVAVLVAGPATAPKIVDLRRVQLADPSEQETIQPYHAGLELPKGQAAKVVAPLVERVERFADRSMAELFREYRERGHRILGTGIVVGSNVDPASIRNDHIRAHAEEGRLFRAVLEKAAKGSGYVTAVTVEKELLEKASKALRRPVPRLKQEVTAMGRGTGGPWRWDEKAAALSAWMILA